MRVLAPIFDEIEEANISRPRFSLAVFGTLYTVQKVKQNKFGPKSLMSVNRNLNVITHVENTNNKGWLQFKAFLIIKIVNLLCFITVTEKPNSRSTKKRPYPIPPISGESKPREAIAHQLFNGKQFLGN